MAATAEGNGQVDLDAGEVETVVLAGVEVEVVPQPPIYLYRRVRRLIGEFSDGLSVEGVDRFEWLLGEQGYRAIGMLIPDVVGNADVPPKIPLHAWLGYASEAEMQTGEDPDETQPPHPPTWPEMRNALRVFTEVNEYDVFERLIGLMDPTTRQDLEEGLAADLTSLVTLLISQSSLFTEDGSEASTSTSETPRTSAAKRSGSPSPASTGSSASTNGAAAKKSKSTRSQRTQRSTTKKH